MLAILSGFFSKAWGYIAAAGVAIAAVGAAFLEVKSAGREQQQAADNDATIKTTKEASDVQNDVAATPAADRRDELRDWTNG